MAFHELIENYVVDFLDDGNLERQRIKKSLHSFHREATRCSYTYRSIVHCVLRLGNIDVYIRDQLENGSWRVSQCVDPRSGRDCTRIEISHKAVKTQVRMGSEDIINALVIKYLIDSVYEAFQTIPLERPSEAVWRHDIEEDTVKIGEDVLKTSAMDMASRVYHEIRDHRVLLSWSHNA
ncbi:hypothetical protein ACHAP4_011165 [Fusarium culmorum]